MKQEISFHLKNIEKLHPIKESGCYTFSVIDRDVIYNRKKMRVIRIITGHLVR